jgi:hypothetical protein
VPNLGQFNLVLPNAGRSGSDEGWQTLQPKYVDAWEAATTCLCEHHIVVGSNRYKVLIDWAGTLRHQKRYYSALRYIGRTRRDTTAYIDRLLKARFPERPAHNPIQVESDSTADAYSLSVAESAVYDSFLIMNIAAPGCCNFYRASLTGHRIEPNISLLNHVFESLVHVALRDTWPPVAFLPLEDVFTWYRSVRPSALQIPSNPMERVLFALFHLCKIDMSPIEVVWLFYAFESLLQTRVGESFSLVVKRLCLLLEADQKRSGIIRKKMRELYDIRSAIVHGGYEVTHPMHDAGLDERVTQTFVRETRAMDYGYALLVAAVQKTITNGWSYPRFSEVIQGEAITTVKTHQTNGGLSH